MRVARAKPALEAEQHAVSVSEPTTPRGEGRVRGAGASGRPYGRVAFAFSYARFTESMAESAPALTSFQLEAVDVFTAPIFSLSTAFCRSSDSMLRLNSALTESLDFAAFALS